MIRKLKNLISKLTSKREYPIMREKYFKPFTVGVMNGYCSSELFNALSNSRVVSYTVSDEPKNKQGYRIVLEDPSGVVRSAYMVIPKFKTQKELDDLCENLIEREWLQNEYIKFKEI